MKNMYYLDKSHYETVEEWINAQKKYFRDRVPKRKHSAHKFHVIEEWMLRLGIVMMFVVLGVFIYETYYHIHLHFPFSWHGAVLASGVLLLGSNFIGRYVNIQGFKEEYHDYEEMQAVFDKAQKHLGLGTYANSAKTTDDATRARVITDLGKKALEENSRWVELHDSRRAKSAVE
ncbi:MAG TPA: hypothetical protein EYG75_05125 [Campylobacterales bacterium]|nr:hypothetical protein [Campylobacterales bacterium]